jgi:hypothetical protein
MLFQLVSLALKGSNLSASAKPRAPRFSGEIDRIVETLNRAIAVMPAG